MKETNYSPGVLSVLPLFYVGWSDSVLGPSERNLLIDAIKNIPGLSKDETELLISWTDQSNPPSEAVFKSWIQSIQQAYDQGLSKEDPLNLIELGISMAKHSVNEADQHFYGSEKVSDALKNLEKCLGAQQRLPVDSLYTKLEEEDLHDDATQRNLKLEKQLTQLLNGEHEELRERVKQLIRDPYFYNQDIQSKELYRTRIREQLKELADQGLSKYIYPTNTGGEASLVKNTIVFESLAHGDLSLLVKFGVQFGLFGGSILALGTNMHHEKYLSDVRTMDTLGCFAMTEQNHGSDVRSLETTAHYQEKTDSFVIHTPHEKACKTYIGNALDGHFAVTFAQLIIKDQSYGVHAFIVPMRNKDKKLFEGIRVEDNGYKMGLNGVDNGKIWFDQVRIPKENLLNKYGDIGSNGVYNATIKSDSKRFFTMLGALVQGRVCVAMASNSCAKNAISIAIRYALKRRQFKQEKKGQETLLLNYALHQKRLFPKLAKTYALHFAMEGLREMVAKIDNQEEPDKKLESLAAGLKAVASWHASDTIQEAREACGGNGYMSENAFGRLKNDAEIFTTFEGDNHVLLQLVARGLLSEFKESFDDGGLFAVLKHLSSRVGNLITDQNPYTIRNTNAEHLLSSEFHISTLEYRENKLLYTLANRMRTFIKRQMSNSEIFSRVQNHMISLAIASIESYVVRRFYLTIEKIDHTIFKSHLARLAKLHALDTIYNQRGWYLENDYISGQKSKAIRKQIEYLTKQVRPYALSYIEGFQIPKDLLRAKFLEE